MGIFVDRRNSNDSESAENRQKFLERHKKQIKKAVKDSIGNIDIKNIGKDGIDVDIEGDLTETTFVHRQGTGTKREARPGNDGHFKRGDSIPKNPSSQGIGNRSSNRDDESVDSFTFKISSSEFMDLFFEDLELPDFIKKSLTKEKSFVRKNAGFTKTGGPQALSINRTFRNSFGRRIASRMRLMKQLKEAEDNNDKELIKEIKEKLKKIPFLDELDIRYNHVEVMPQFKSNAVMFCLMDVSASMGEMEKDLAKRFYILLYLFLQKNYTNVDLVFIRHTTEAKEVGHNEFFYNRESGGTMISSGLRLINKIIDERYDLALWNIYVAQTSDGDNFEHDNEDVISLMEHKLLPKIQYYAYIEVRPEGTEEWRLWRDDGESTIFKIMAKMKPYFRNLAVGVLTQYKDIWPVFKQLFKKKSTVNG